MPGSPAMSRLIDAKFPLPTPPPAARTRDSERRRHIPSPAIDTATTATATIIRRTVIRTREGACGHLMRFSHQPNVVIAAGVGPDRVEEFVGVELG